MDWGERCGQWSGRALGLNEETRRFDFGVKWELRTETGQVKSSIWGTGLAQWVKHLTLDLEVVSSSPTLGAEIT